MLAERIFAHAQETGFDLAVARSLGVDHAIGAPAHLCLPEDGSVKAVAVYMASGVARICGCAGRMNSVRW